MRTRGFYLRFQGTCIHRAACTSRIVRSKEVGITACQEMRCVPYRTTLNNISQPQLMATLLCPVVTEHTRRPSPTILLLSAHLIKVNHESTVVRE